MTAALATAAPTAEQLADGAAVAALLNCYLRETGTPVPPTGPARLRLERLGLTVTAPLRYRSPTGRHAFELPALLHAGGRGTPLDHATLAALLGKELALRSGVPPAALLGAVLDSTRNLAVLAGAGRPAAPTPFLDAEQSLALGHPLHPAPKSRQPMEPADVRRYSPELGAAFPLHWLRADPAAVDHDSALPAPAPELLAGLVPELEARGGVLLPAHPWQARRLLAEPGARALLAAGALEDLGTAGAPWYPTSSVRTLYRPGAPVMLKLSLDVRITNSVRRNLPKELARGAEVARLLDAGLGAELAARFPRFGIVRDPAWARLPAAGGFEVVLRESPWPAAGGGVRPTVLAALCSQPERLAAVVAEAAGELGSPREEVARAWFRRYLEVALDPLLWLQGAWGIALEAHQQNSVVELRGGWPEGFRYRDNQGYYFKESAAPRLRRLLPGLNRSSDTVCDDAVADERFGYYVGVNNLLGLVGAFGAAGLAGERALLADLAAHLRRAAGQADPPPPLARTLLESETLRCKANLLTRLHDLDELAGPLAEQSVYVDWPNPLLAAAP